MSDDNKVPEITTDKKEKKKKTPAQIALIVVIVLFVVMLILICAAYMVFHHYYSKLDYDDGKVEFKTTEDAGEEPDPEVGSDSDADEIERLEEHMQEIIGNGEVMSSKHVVNILLIGQDSRDKYTLGRSDTIMVLSINKDTKKIAITSIMRDSYVSIPGYGNRRINAAYANGGPDLLIDTIEQNFKINIDSYVSVNFYSFMDVVEAVGGIDVTLTDKEARVCNECLAEMNKLLGDEKGADYLDGAGNYHLNGKQALAYARIRHVGNSDYDRTERQRAVLEQVFNKAKDQNLAELNDTLNIVLPKLLTDISEQDMLSLLLNFTKEYKNYDIEKYRVPCDGTITGLTINGAQVLGIDFNKNIEYIQNAIYGEQ